MINKIRIRTRKEREKKETADTYHAAVSFLKRMEVNSFMNYIRGNYSVQLIKLTGVSLLSADCAEDNGIC